MDNNNNSSKAPGSYSYQDLCEYICEVFQISKITPQMERQISDLILNYDLNYKDIARCINWEVEVAHEGVKIQYGIAFCKNVKEPALKFFKKLAEKKREQEEQAKKFVESSNNIIFKIDSIKHEKRKPKSFDVSEIDVGEGGQQ